jgi:cyclopropane-fatty-acyl-phospholipid synthase
MNQTSTLRSATTQNRDTRLVFEMLQKLQGGMLDISLPDHSQYLFGSGSQRASLTVHNEDVFRQVLARGDIGLAESYLDGHWDSPDITSLLALIAHNRAPFKKAIYGAWHHLILARIRHAFNRNNRAGSKRNIMAHYDLGNDFYKLWLDTGMSYSSALFDNAPARSLETAQHAKYQRILQRLNAKPGQHLLEIGCGWGGFAELAVQEKLHITGLTLSPAQLDWAQQRVPQADLRLQDYRDINTKFDHIVSIEMLEAVGRTWWPDYFRTIARSLKPGGKAIIQSIVIRDDLFAAYRKKTDFIQQFIFPGGMLPSPKSIKDNATRAGLFITDSKAFGQDYARTLAAWRQSFENHWTAISELGFDERFRRLWRLYLTYCEAGFLSGNIDVMQLELQHA